MYILVWSCRLVGIAEIINGEALIEIYVWWRVVFDTAYSRVVEFKEGEGGWVVALSINLIWLYGYFQLNRYISERDIFTLNILSSNHNVINMNSDVVWYDDVNCSLDVVVDGGWRILYSKCFRRIGQSHWIYLVAWYNVHTLYYVQYTPEEG